MAQLTPSLEQALLQAVNSGDLLPESLANIRSLLARSTNPLYPASVEELAAAQAWDELNDRFFRTIAFGTGGIRGRTISRVVTSVEKGELQAMDRPQFCAVGTNAMNDYNISRATQGLARYLKKWFASENLPGRPSVCISYDTRFFSVELAALIAKVLTESGCDALVFEAPRSTPELSFAVRFHRASAGINVTASHNPPPYNGYKVYFADGAQVVEPHASGIIAEVNAVESDVYEPLPAAEQGRVTSLGKETDDAYMLRLESLLLDPELVRRTPLKIVYTPLHGVGAVIVKPMLERLGFSFSTVASQEIPDSRFPTVKSPNPEVAEALSLAIAQADAEGADLVLATDPDDDRMGVAARGRDGAMHLLTGNQIGSLMAWYRAKRHFDLGILTTETASRGVIIKTFVTTDLQKSIADKLGLRCVETLTGFKYNGEKLLKYELAIPESERGDYITRSEEETRALRLKYSSLYVFGGEESYGYSGADFTRDKDGNGAVVMFSEVASYAKSIDKTLHELLDEIYSEFGFYLERPESLTFEGAEGAAKIQTLVESYAAHPPEMLGGKKVIALRNFAKEDVRDIEGDLIPKEAMLMVHLEGGWKIAVRPSGTEPKIKFYLFAVHECAAGEKLDPAHLAEIKEAVSKGLEALWQDVKEDVDRRLRG